jgi:hypothetical protein
MVLGPQFEQLKMFMAPSEIDPSSSIDAEQGEYIEDVMEEKLEEAKNSGLYDDIRQKGVKTPIQVIHDPHTGEIMLGHGNHRFAVAQDLENQGKSDVLLPVVHSIARYEKYYEDDDPGYFDALRTVKDYDNYMNRNFGQGRGTGDKYTWQSDEDF